MVWMCLNSQTAEQHLPVFKDVSSCLNKMKVCVVFMFLGLFVVINGKTYTTTHCDGFCACQQLEVNI